MRNLQGDPGYPAGWCIHYRAPRDQVTSCEAGVEYATFHATKFERRPCFLDQRGQSKPGAVTCQHLRRPTPEEIAAHAQWTKAHIDRLTTVMLGIADWRKRHRGRAAAETVECPACKGRLHLSIAGNGHTRGRCETEGCVSWMQ